LERRALGLALAIVAVVAVWRIDATALWLDEAYSLGAANHLGESLRQTSGTMGGYYVLLAAWSSVSTATWWLRLLSVVAAALTLVTLRPVARRIGGSRLVAVALPLCALNPAFSAKSIEARSYALVGLLTVLCWQVVVAHLDRADRSRPDRTLWLLAPLGVAGTLGHGLFLVQFAAIAVVLALAPRWRRSLPVLVAAAVPAIGVVLALRANGADSIGTTISGGPGVLLASTFDALLARPVPAKVILAVVVTVAIAAAVRAAATTRPSLERAIAAIPAAWAVLPCIALAAMVIDPVYNPRYLAPVAPGIALVLATAAVAADDALACRLGRRRAVLGPAAVTLGVLSAWSLAVTPPVYDHDWRGAAGHVAAEAQPGDGIVFANLSAGEPVQQRPPFEAAWREVTTPVRPAVVSPARPLAEVRRVEVPLALEDLAGAARGHRRVWVVEDQAPGVAVSPRVIEALGDDFVTVDRQVFRPGIVVVLLARR
jgi:hypothetical protein